MVNVTRQRVAGLAMLVALALVAAPQAMAQWSAQPGETTRNAFGPPRGDKTSVCRGACGLGCPDTCSERVSYECMDSTLMRRVRTYECGSHLGCRRHDDCLDDCSQSGLAFGDCQSRCHQEAVERFGLETAVAWASGRGPYDGAPITFEYTRASPGAPEPAFRCPEGASLECSGAAGRCVTARGTTVEPVFDSYASPGAAAMRVSGFRAGRLCGESVCEQTNEIRVTGDDTCLRNGADAPCTRYGMEFDYRGADPSQPLVCFTSTEGGKTDFIGDLLVKGLSAMPDLESETDVADGSGKEQVHGMRVLLDVFKKVVTSADSPEDVRVSMAPLGPDGQPIESQRVGAPADAGPPSAPRTVAIPATEGRLVVPMYQIAEGTETGPLTREIRCSHKGVPVLETIFRLSF